MARKQCSKGHIYDSTIYGDNCPFCPGQGTGTIVNDGSTKVSDGNDDGKRTFIGQPTQGSNPTISMGGSSSTAGTVIRPAAGNGTTSGTPSGKKLVGFLVTYDHNPSGQSFNLYEGRNYIGRDTVSEIRIPEDSQISGKHFSILFRSVDGKFKYKDEQSSNGTFINETLQDEGELKNQDIIRIGSTRLIFITIPQIQ